eukprot:TRINITY_DN4458_c0_g1_i1.p1 TRINITY_DN4458_c0_g1~~TRINITY_DN4458_c0_g1_i1.p1  ORF type:complete len:840 (+),score=135.71 TRINITY_DN4458_c0_g1_i1:61-2580(+)
MAGICSCFARCSSLVLCFIWPAADVLSGYFFFVFCLEDGAPSVLGWSLHVPVVLLVARLVWLSLLVPLSLCRKLATLEGFMEAAFPYAVLVPYAALCIVRLVTDPPPRLSEREAAFFWAAALAGAVLGIAETYFTLPNLEIVRKAAQSRAHAQSPESLGQELLQTGGSGDSVPEGTSHADNAQSTSSTAGASDAEAAQSSGSANEDEQVVTTLVQGDTREERSVSIKQLLNVVKVDWPLLIQACCFLFVAAIADVMIPHYIGMTISEIVAAEKEGTLASRPYKGPVIKLLLAAGCSAIFSSCRGATFIVIGGRFSKRLRQQLFASLYRQEIGFYDTTKTGELTSRMTQDCQKVSDQVELNVNVFLRTLVSTVTTLVFMFSLSVSLTLVAFVSIPVVVFISKKYGKIMKALSEKTQEALADANAVADEGLATMSTIRSFAAEDLENQRYSVTLGVFLRLVHRKAAFYLLYLSSAMMLPQAVTALVLFYGGKLALEGQLHSSSLVSFVLYLQTLNSNFSTIGDFYTNMVTALGAAARVFQLIEREPEVPSDGEAGAVPTKVQGALRLRDVHFSYPARPNVQILKGLDLDIEAGQTVALVGPSGNGKSTVVGLVKRLYKAQRGQVLLDDIDVWRYPHAYLHRVISIVSQEPVLYARSIRDNIAFGIENPRQVAGETLPATPDSLIQDSEIEEFSKKANAHDFVMDMPKRYDTEVGERGVQLSGGQKQRIAIARALARNPKVLLLDEATSALDTQSETQVQKAIDGMIKDGCMTVVIIAHRLSTVQNSHKICVVKGGKVVEEGTHSELLARGGDYFKLVHSQLGAAAVPGDQNNPSTSPKKDS